MRVEETSRIVGLADSGDWSGPERSAIFDELERILSDPAFNRSRRCASLLRCMIEHTLIGDLERLRERSLGVEVFGRPADYNPSADPVVRMAANDIRKRLAQYYQRPHRRNRVMIRVLAGSYMPEFDFFESETVTDVEVSSAPKIDLEAPSLTTSGDHAGSDSSPRLKAKTTRLRLALACLCLLVVSLVSYTVQRKYFQSRQQEAWSPLLASEGDVTVYLADNINFAKGGYQYLPREKKVAAVEDIIHSLSEPSMPDLANTPRAIPFEDALAAHQISVWLGLHGKASVLAPVTKLSPENVHHGPAVFVGAFDNPWTLILSSKLRYRPDYDAVTGNSMIRDTQKLGDRQWVKDRTPGAQPPVDYAVISRFFYPETQNWIVIVAGLGEAGTRAASQLLTDPSVASILPSIPASKNVQIVLKTTIINGTNAPAQVLATYSW